MTQFIKADRKTFNLFIRWYDSNISTLHTYSAMVADRLNYFNKDEKLIAYLSLGMETYGYIKEEDYKSMTQPKALVKIENPLHLDIIRKALESYYYICKDNMDDEGKALVAEVEKLIIKQTT